MSAQHLNAFLLYPVSHRSQRDRGGRQTNQTSVPRMRLVHGVGIVVTELLDDLCDFFVFSSENGISNDFL